MKFNSITNTKAPHDEEIHNDGLNYLVVFPVLVAAFLSFLYLDAKSFWLDEVYSISFAKLSWSRLWVLISQREANASPYYVLLKLWVGAFGDGEFAVRSLSAIFAVGAVFMACAIGVRLLDTRTGLTAGFILAVNAFFIQYAQEARGYTLLLLLVTFSMYLFIRAIEKQQYKYYIALGMTNALVLYAHFCGFLVVVAQLISLVFLPPGTIRWRRVVTCAILTASLAAPLGVFMVTHQPSPLAWVQKPSLHDLFGLFKDFAGTHKGNFPQRALLVSYFVLCLFSFVFAVRVLVRFKRGQLLWRHGLVLCWLFVPILSLYLVSMFKPAFVARYLISCLPALVLLAAAGLSSFRTKALHMLATSILVVLSLHAIFYVYYPEKKDDWRSAARFVVQNGRAGDAILFYGPPAIVPFEYYYEKMNGRTDTLVSVYPFLLASPVGYPFLIRVSNPVENMLESLNERFSRLWVVLAYDIIPGLGWDSRPIVHTIEKKYIDRENISLKGINIRLYERH
jgi:mannosyltransferase